MSSNNGSRIVYVEPNDVFTAHNDITGTRTPLTPPYEDMNIAFNLIVEKFPRYKTDIENGDANGIATAEEDFKNGKTTMMLSWFNTSGNEHSFTSGSNFGGLTGADGPTYLTTYYTDISYDNYGNFAENSAKRVVEGLGVESINVSFESWYTPTVAIKFVDVRGSALWGNEEAIYSSDDEITVDNIFGCFFEFPFPKFRLQMKGFLGKPVTYQLTCSSFKGEYDAQTGNFIVNVNFIGYSYSLLTDIPFEYLIIAPDCGYVGKSYWDEHVNKDDSWKLTDDSGHNTIPPKKLRDILKRIRDIDKADNEKQVIGGSTVSESEAEAMSGITDEKTALLSIKRAFGELETAWQSFTFPDGTTKGNYIVHPFADTGNRQYVLFLNNVVDGRVTVTEDIKNRTKELYDAVTEYNNAFPLKKIESDKFPNGWTYTVFDSLPATKLMSITKPSDTITNITLINNVNTISELKEIAFPVGHDNKKVFLNEKNASNILDFLRSYGADIDFSEYVYVLNLNGLETFVNNRLSELGTEENAFLSKAEERFNANFERYLGFKPYIGNIFKIIMCHLETFVHMILAAGVDIYNEARGSLRTPKRLGIDLDETDVIASMSRFGKDVAVPPWPLVVDKGVTMNGMEQSPKNNTIAWVGDKSHNFVEEKVVLGIQTAIREFQDEFREQKKGMEYVSFPILPSDFNNTSISPYSELRSVNRLGSNMAYFTMRGMSILGVMLTRGCSQTVAESLGRIEAINYYIGAKPATDIDDTILSKLGGKSFSDIAVGIATCDPEYDTFAESDESGENSYYEFEKIPNWDESNGRHPLIIEEGEDYVFNHFRGKGDIDYMPTELLSDFNQYNNVLSYKDGVFVPRFDGGFGDGKLIADKWIYTSNSIDVLDNTDNGDYEKVYNNLAMYDIVVDESFCDSLEKCREKATSETDVDIREVKLKPSLDKTIAEILYGRTDGKGYEAYLHGSTMLLPKNSVVGISSSQLLPKGKISISDDVDFTKNLISGLSCSYSDDKWRYDGKEYEVEDLRIATFNSYSGDSEACLFGRCPYYLQNNHKDNDIKNKAKALLFLHTFKYEKYKLAQFFATDGYQTLCDIVPYGFALLMGGLLWRKRYKNEKGTDPILMSENGGYKYYNPGVDYTFFSANSTHLKFDMVSNDKSSGKTYLSVNSFFESCYGKGVDCNAENRLIELFEDFATGDFVKITDAFELKGINGGKIIEFTAASFTKASQQFYKYLKDSDEKLDNNKAIWEKFTTELWTGWQGNYDMISWDSDSFDAYNCLQMLVSEDCEAQQLAKNIFLKKICILNGTSKQLNNANGSDGKIKVSKEYFKAYMDGFGKALQEIVNAYKAGNTTTTDEVAENSLKKNRDIYINIYKYIKNLWDKWLLAATYTEYNVGKFFKDNFFFIDSFYRNTYNVLPLNCGKLFDIMVNPAEDRSLFSVMNDIVSQHHCIFFALPDWIGFDGNPNQEGDTNKMQDLFRPMAYNDMPSKENNNKFVIIYTYEPSHIQSNVTYFTKDGFDIWKPDGKLDKDVISIFSSSPVKYDGSQAPSLYGYNVPSFGVSMNRQHNHIFKNIKVNMNNPTVTESSIKLYERVVELGSRGEKKFSFCGQDVYSIYSNYAYECEVEMIGNAQICPLMYFQLLNVPMWNGAYMIFNVKHTMVPGNMTTTFKGMKLSKVMVPFVRKFFDWSPGRPGDSTNGGLEYDGGIRNGNENFVVLLAPGHPTDPKPWNAYSKKEGRWIYHKENEWNQDMAKRVQTKLTNIGVKSLITGQFNNDTYSAIAQYGQDDTLFIGIDVNGIDKGKREYYGVDKDDNGVVNDGWLDASGATVFVADAHPSQSMRFAQVMVDKIKSHNLECIPISDFVQNNIDRAARGEKPYGALNILYNKYPKCAAILTENFFKSNEDDAIFLNSENGKNIISQYHVDAIVAYMQETGKWQEVGGVVYNGYVPSGGGTFKMMSQEEILKEFQPQPYPFAGVPPFTRTSKDPDYEVANIKVVPRVAYSQLGTVTDFPLVKITKPYDVATTKPGTCSDGTHPIGVQENNWLNINHSSTDIGYVGQGRRHAKFDSYINGLASTFRYWLKAHPEWYKQKSLIEMNNAFQGFYKDDEQVGLKALRVTWITHIADWLGVNPWDRLDNTDKNTAFWIMACMARQETSSQISKADMETAWAKLNT